MGSDGRSLIIGVDFDGTCTTHDFPRIGHDIGAQRVLRRLVEAGHRLVLFTMRSDKPEVEVVPGDASIMGISGRHLSAAVEWFKKNEIPLWGVNENPEQKSWTTSPKAYCHIYIDDAALGIPLIKPAGGRPFVWWEKVEIMLEALKVLPEQPNFRAVEPSKEQEQ